MNQTFLTIGYFLRGLPVWTVLQVLGAMRPGSARAISRPLAFMLRLILRRRMQVVAQNLDLCFGEKTPGQRRQLLIQHSRQQIYGLYETTQALHCSSADLPEHRIDGVAEVLATVRKGKGILLVGGHFTGMDLWLRLAGEQLPLVTVHRPLKNPLMQRYFSHGRGQSSTRLISKHQPRAILQALRSGEIVWLQSDQNSRGRNSQFVNFFGYPASTSISPWWLAEKTGAAVYTIHPSKAWKGNAYQYVLAIEPVEAVSAGSEPGKLLLAINQKLEQAVRKLPASYWWVHRRFKTRPAGESSFYSD